MPLPFTFLSYLLNFEGCRICLGLDELRETVEKLKLQVAESTRQESLLVMRLAAKEQEVQELLVSVRIVLILLISSSSVVERRSNTIAFVIVCRFLLSGINYSL